MTSSTIGNIAKDPMFNSGNKHAIFLVSQRYVHACMYVSQRCVLHVHALCQRPRNSEYSRSLHELSESNFEVLFFLWLVSHGHANAFFLPPLILAS